MLFTFLLLISCAVGLREPVELVDYMLHFISAVAGLLLIIERKVKQYYSSRPYAEMASFT